MIVPDSVRKELLTTGDDLQTTPTQLEEDLQTEKVKTQQISDDFNTAAAHHLRQEEAARILRQTERDMQRLENMVTEIKIYNAKAKLKIAEKIMTPILSKLNL